MAVFTFINPARADERDGFGVGFIVEQADAFVGEGGEVTKVVPALPKPIGKGLGNPSVDVGDDLTGAGSGNAEGTGNIELFAAAESDEAVDVEVTAGREVERCHVLSPANGD